MGLGPFNYVPPKMEAIFRGRPLMRLASVNRFYETDNCDHLGK